MKKRINPAHLKRPTPEESRRAAETLIRQHIHVAYGLSGIQKSYIQGGPDVAIYTVSGALISLFDDLLRDIANDRLEFEAISTAADVKPVTDSELVELRKIAGLPKQ